MKHNQGGKAFAIILMDQPPNISHRWLFPVPCLSPLAVPHCEPMQPSRSSNSHLGVLPWPLSAATSTHSFTVPAPLSNPEPLPTKPNTHSHLDLPYWSTTMSARSTFHSLNRSLSCCHVQCHGRLCTTTYGERGAEGQDKGQGFRQRIGVQTDRQRL